MLRFFPQRNPFLSSTGFFEHSMNWLLTTGEDITLFKVDNKTPQTPQVGVYFLHGYADRVVAGKKVFGRIKSVPAEIDSIVLLSNGLTTLSQTIEQLADNAVEKMQKNGHKFVILSGHSMGGIIQMRIIEKAAKVDIKVIGVITICSPINGQDTWIARLCGIVSPAIAQMSLNSKWIKEFPECYAQSQVQFSHYSASEDVLVQMKSAVVSADPDSLVIFDKGGKLTKMTMAEFLKRLEKKIPLDTENDMDPEKLKEMEAKNHRLVILDNHGHVSIMTSTRLSKYLSADIERFCEGFRLTREYKLEVARLTALNLALPSMGISLSP